MTPTLSRTVLYCFAVFCLSFGLAALPWLPPPAQAADITILGGSGGGGGGGNGATQGTAGTNGANSIGGQGGGGGYGASGTGNAGGGGGASFINGTYHTDRNGGDASGSTPGTAGTVVGSGSVGFAGEANSSHQGGRGGVGAQAILNTSDTAADNIYVYGGNGGQGGQGGTTAGYYGGDGGGGGRAALTLNNNINVFGNVYVQSGRGGNGARNPNGSGTSGAGGTGDDASLSLSGALTANRVYVITSGDGQTNTTFPLNPGAGGNVGFFAGSLAAQYIDLLKNTGGNLAFNVGTLDVTSGDTTIDIFRTTAGTTSTVMGDDGVYIGTARLGNGQLQITSVLNNPGSALIDTLQLVGRGGFSDTTNPVTTGNLTVDGGTLHNGNWSGLIDRTYTTSDITLGSSGATVELGTGEDKTLARVLTGSGDLTKTGAGMLTLSVANTYSGTTTVSGGTLRLEDAGAAGSATSAISTGTVGNEGTLALAFNGGFTRNVSGAGGLTADPGFGNTLTLSGASNAYTGMTTVQSGTLQLGSPLASTHLTLHGGATFNQNSQTHTLDNGSLTVRGENATYDGDLSATSATLNFIAPASVSQPLLTVTGTADITGSAVNLGVSGGTSLPKGTQLTLVKTTILTNLTANNLTQGSGIVEAGVTAIYGLALEVDPVTGLLRGTVTTGGATEQAKALSEGFIGGAVLVNQGADLIAGPGMASAVKAARAGSGAGDVGAPYGLAAFASVSGGSVRYNSGSHVDVSSLSLLAGLAKGVELEAGRLTLGAFFEYGNGSYDTYNSFSNAAAVHGEGDIHHTGGGLLGRMDFSAGGPGNFYAEASARAGGVSNQYSSSDLQAPAGGRAEYDSSSAYYGLHLGLGYVFSLTEAASLDFYGKYFWTRQEGDSVTLSTGDPVAFADVDSQRLRLGGRLAYAANEYVSPYIGAAYEHEFDGRARATTNGFAIDAPSLRGDTGIGELGLTLKPSPNLPLSFDLGVQGYVGKREGVTGSLQARFEF